MASHFLFYFYLFLFIKLDQFESICESLKTSIADIFAPVHMSTSLPLSCPCEIHFRRWKGTSPLSPACYAPAEWTLQGLNVCPPCPAAGGVCFTGLCNVGPGGIRFHRYKSFHFNPITQSEWSGLRASA